MSHAIVHLVLPVSIIILMHIFGLKLRTGLLSVFLLGLGKEIYDFVFWKDTLSLCLWDMLLNIISMFLASVMLFIINEYVLRYSGSN